MTDTAPSVQPVMAELLDLAATATDNRIDRSRLQGAILAAQTAGWSWGRITTAVAGMLARGEEPRDLLNAIEADPVRRYVRKDHQ